MQAKSAKIVSLVHAFRVPHCDPGRSIILLACPPIRLDRDKNKPIIPNKTKMFFLIGSLEQS
jgi:hypothetical protein